MLFGWVLFASGSTGAALRYAGTMLSFQGGGDWGFLVRNNFVLLALSVLMCVPPVVRALIQPLREHAALRVITGLALLILCVSSLVSESFNPFLYFRF